MKFLIGNKIWLLLLVLNGWIVVAECDDHFRLVASAIAFGVCISRLAWADAINKEIVDIISTADLGAETGEAL